jgi:hypothetical protein
MPPARHKNNYSRLCKNKSITLGKFLTFIQFNAYLLKIRLSRLTNKQSINTDFIYSPFKWLILSAITSTST